MAVYQLGRETDIVGHHHVRTSFVVFERRRGGELYLDATGRKQRVPEREVLIGVQTSGDANGQWQRCTVADWPAAAEKQLGFL